MKRSDWVVSLVVLCCVFTGPARAQEVPGDGDAINLFFDCQGGGCYDLGFFRREIPSRTGFATARCRTCTSW